MSMNLNMTATKQETPPSILQQAEATINGPRQQDYGDKRINFSQIAMLWTAQLAMKLNAPITPEDVALCMIQVKAARLAKSPDHFDSQLDIAGYIGCYNRIQSERTEAQIADERRLPGVLEDSGR